MGLNAQFAAASELMSEVSGKCSEIQNRWGIKLPSNHFTLRVHEKPNQTKKIIMTIRIPRVLTSNSSEITGSITKAREHVIPILNSLLI